MQWYKLIWWDRTANTPFVSTSGDLKGVDDWDLTSGRMLSSWNDSAWIRCDDPAYDGDPDDVLANHLGVPIYSSRLIKAIESQGIGGIQYLPIRVFRCEGSELQGYQIANILSKVPALDLKRSDYSIFAEDYFIPERRGSISAIRKAVLIRNKLMGLDVFRLSEFPLYEIVSQRFKDMFENGRFTGYSFQKLSAT
jgi:hypothetical protein